MFISAKLKPGTLLVWDAPLPFKGYKSYYSLSEDKLLYPAVIGEQNSDVPELVRVYTMGSSNWLSGEIEQLRSPTKEELNGMNWKDIIDKYKIEIHE